MINLSNWGLHDRWNLFYTLNDPALALFHLCSQPVKLFIDFYYKWTSWTEKPNQLGLKKASRWSCAHKTIIPGQESHFSDNLPGILTLHLPDRDFYGLSQFLVSVKGCAGRSYGHVNVGLKAKCHILARAVRDVQEMRSTATTQIAPGCRNMKAMIQSSQLEQKVCTSHYIVLDG